MPEFKITNAKRMRNNPTPAEAVLWAFLRARRCRGLKFRRQVPMLGWIADFYCPERRLVIEVDGEYHQAAVDRKRDAAMGKRGIRVLRFRNTQVLEATNDVLAVIIEQA